MNLKAKIEELLRQLQTEGFNFYVIEVQVSVSRVKTKASILLDTHTGISIDECATISRELSKRLDELNLTENAYTLEVSSPGVDTPLKFEWQYLKNIGRNVRVFLTDGSEQTGKLEAVNASSITLQAEIKSKKKNQEPAPPQLIPFEQINKTQVLISFKG